MDMLYYYYIISTIISIGRPVALGKIPSGSQGVNPPFLLVKLQWLLSHNMSIFTPVQHHDEGSNHNVLLNRVW